MMYIIIAIAILCGHERIPFADTLGQEVMEVLGGAPTQAMKNIGEDGWDLLVAGAVAVPYWVVLQLLVAAGKAGMGGTKGPDNE